MTATNQTTPAPAAPAAAAPSNPAPATPAPVPAPAAAPVAAAPAPAPIDELAVRREAAAAERARVLGIQALARSPNDEVVTACINDANCSVEAAALRIAQDTKAKADGRITARAENERTTPLPTGAAPASSEPAPGAQLVAALHLIRPPKAAAH